VFKAALGCTPGRNLMLIDNAAILCELIDETSDSLYSAANRFIFELTQICDVG
jgi:hypothetical protein